MVFERLTALASVACEACLALAHPLCIVTRTPPRALCLGVCGVGIAGIEAATLAIENRERVLVPCVEISGNAGTRCELVPKHLHACLLALVSHAEWLGVVVVLCDGDGAAHERARAALGVQQLVLKVPRRPSLENFQ